jgi:hypothetical protein
MSDILIKISQIENSIADLYSQKKPHFPSSDTFDSEGSHQDLGEIASYLSFIKNKLPEHMASVLEETIINLHKIDESIKHEESTIELYNNSINKKISYLHLDIEKELSDCPEKNMKSSLFVNIIALSNYYNDDVRNILDIVYKNLGITHVSKHGSSDYVYYDSTVLNDLNILIAEEFSDVCSQLGKPIVDIGVYISYFPVASYTSELVKIVKSKI